MLEARPSHERRFADFAEKCNDVPVRMNAPGAVARQVTNFGDATSYGKVGGE